MADAGHDGLVVEDLARIDERRVAGTVSGELCPADAEPRGDAGQGVARAHGVGAPAGGLVLVGACVGHDLTVTILTALGTLVGALIGASTIKARRMTQE